MRMHRRIKILIILTFVVCGIIFFQINVNAQHQKHFSPMRFEAELEQFIVEQAGLTPEESSRFFPVYREMRKKQFGYFIDNRRFRYIDPNNDSECAKVIRMRDNSDLEVKKIQQQYHNKFLKILSAGKVFKILEAEDKFHRNLFMGNKPPDK
jgi:hypothetical protein